MHGRHGRWERRLWGVWGTLPASCPCPRVKGVECEKGVGGGWGGTVRCSAARAAGSAATSALPCEWKVWKVRKVGIPPNRIAARRTGSAATGVLRLSEGEGCGRSGRYWYEHWGTPHCSTLRQ
eukprot:350655-Chlamydomonas_euryale.AAC.1